MDFAVDFQGYTASDGKFLLKEIAIVGIQENVVAHFFIRWYYPFRYLEQNDGNNPFLSVLPHGIPWDEGYVTTDQAFNVLRDILTSYSSNRPMIFVKGSQKADYLRNKITNRAVVDLDYLGCPSLEELEFVNSSECKNLLLECYFPPHSSVHRIINKYTCALAIAQKLKYWYLNKQRSSIPSLSAPSLNFLSNIWRYLFPFYKRRRSQDEHVTTQKGYDIPNSFGIRKCVRGRSITISQNTSTVVSDC